MLMNSVQQAICHSQFILAPLLAGTYEHKDQRHFPNTHQITFYLKLTSTKDLNLKYQKKMFE